MNTTRRFSDTSLHIFQLLQHSIIKTTLENHLCQFYRARSTLEISVHSQNAKLVQIEFRANVQYFCQYTTELAKFEMNELPGVRINISHCFPSPFEN